MSEAVKRKRVGRRAVLGLLAAAVPSARPAIGGTLAKLSVRDVVASLRNAQNGQRPDLSRRDLSELNLSELDFKGADLTGSNLFGADLTACNLDRATLSHAILDRAVLVRARFENATLKDALIRRPSVFSDMSFDARDLPIFRNANLANVVFTARLDGADFSGADLSNASFAVWQERDLGGTPTSGLARCSFIASKMRGTNMRGLSLAHSVFRNADLREADLRDTDLTGADLTDANLTGALLEGAKLDGATLEAVIGLPTPSSD